MQASHQARAAETEAVLVEAEAVAEQNRVGGPPTTHEAKPAAAVSLGEAEAPCCKATRLSSATLDGEGNEP